MINAPARTVFERCMCQILKFGIEGLSDGKAHLVVRDELSQLPIRSARNHLHCERNVMFGTTTLKPDSAALSLMLAYTISAMGAKKHNMLTG